MELTRQIVIKGESLFVTFRSRISQEPKIIRICRASDGKNITDRVTWPDFKQIERAIILILRSEPKE